MKINKLILSRLITNIKKTDDNRPSQFQLSGNIIIDPRDDFVLCRDESGKPTAIFARNIWDFKPYATTNDKPSKLYFKLKKKFSSIIRSTLEKTIYSYFLTSPKPI